MARIGLLYENELMQKMQQTVMPVLQAAREEALLQMADGSTLFVLRYRAHAPRGSVVILHGLGENAEKYRELSYYFLQSGLNVLIYEQRGHGRSTRTAELGVIHVEDFSQYVEDLAAVLQSEASFLVGKRYLFAHSMGGAVAALYLERATGFFDKAVLASPMIYMHRKGVPRKLGELVCHVGCRLRRRASRFFALGPAPAPAEERFEELSCSSEARFAYYRSVKAESPLLYAGKASNGWILQAMRCPHRILKRGRPERVETPLRVYAAEQETLVDERPQKRFAERVQRGEFFVVRNCKHEIYFATDQVLHPFIKEVLAYFDGEA